MDSIRFIFRRAKLIYQTEGLGTFLSRGMAFIKKRFFEYRTYYLTMRILDDPREASEADIVPRINGLTFKMISTNKEADELEADGYEFRAHPHFIDGRKALDAGAIACCVFVGRELVASGWVALNQEAMNTLNEPPMRIDFAGGEAFTGGVWTHPKYRGMGLRTYRSFKIRQFMRQRGFVRVPGYSTRKDADAASRDVSRVGKSIYAEARYLKILWWTSWKEKPFTPE